MQATSTEIFLSYLFLNFAYIFNRLHDTFIKKLQLAKVTFPLSNNSLQNFLLVQGQLFK